MAMACDYKIYVQNTYYTTFHCTSENGYNTRDAINLVLAGEKLGAITPDRTQPVSVRIEKVLTP